MPAMTVPFPREVLRRRLEAKRRELTAGLLRTGVFDPDDIGERDSTVGGQISTADLDRRFLLLSQVADALARLSTGEYGCCLKCGAEIAPERLQAVPWTPHCLHCQEVAENAERASVAEPVSWQMGRQRGTARRRRVSAR